MQREKKTTYEASKEKKKKENYQEQFNFLGG